MIIEIDMENDANTETSRVHDSISSVLGSTRASTSTLFTTELQSLPTSSLSKANSTTSSFSRITSNTSSISIIASHTVTSPIVRHSIQSPTHSSITTTSKNDSNYMVTSDDNNPNRCKNENLNKRNKRRKKVSYFTLTDSSYCLYLRNRLIEDNISSVVSLSSIWRTAINHFESIK